MVVFFWYRRSSEDFNVVMSRFLGNRLEIVGGREGRIGGGSEKRKSIVYIKMLFLFFV